MISSIGITVSSNIAVGCRIKFQRGQVYGFSDQFIIANDPGSCWDGAPALPALVPENND